MASRLVGRHAELARILATIEAPAPGVVAVAITGDGGVGKTVLLDAALDHLRRGRWEVLSGRADPLERSIPYAALARIVAPMAERRDPVLAPLARELIDHLDLLGGGPRSDVESSFGQVCGLTTAVVKALLDRKPLAVGIDEVDALDDDTVSALAIVLRRLTTGRVAVLTTSRSAVPSASPLLAALVRRLETDGTVDRLTLTGLPTDELVALVTPILGGVPDAAVMGEIETRSGGNPFFASTIAQSLRDADLVTIDGRQARLTGDPSDFRLTRANALLARFTPLHPDSRRVLQVVTVLGRVTVDDLPLITAVTGIEAGDVATAFDDLVRGGLITEDGEGYGVTHDLVRDAVYEDIGPAHRRHLHQAVADRMRAQRDSGHTVDVLALARHLSASAQADDAAAALIIAEAGDLTRRVAPGSAAALYARAVALLPGDDPNRWSLLARRSRALSLALRPAEAVAAGRAALGGDLDPDERARTAASVVASLVDLGRLDEALDVAGAAIAMGAGNGVLLAQRSMVLWYLTRFAESFRDADEAVRWPTASPAERVLVLGPLALPAAYTGRPMPLWDLAAEMLSLRAELPTSLQLYASGSAAYSLVSSGYPAAAAAPLADAEELLERLGHAAVRGNILVARVFVDWLAGRWDEALEDVAASRWELEGAELELEFAALEAVEIEIRSQRGERVPADLMRRAAATPNFAELKAWAVAGACEAAGDLDGARAALESARQASERVAYLALLLARGIEVELAAGDTAAAAVLLDDLEREASRLPRPWSEAWFNLAAALVYRDPSAACAAVEVADSEALVFEAARARLALGMARPDATDELLDAYRTFQSLGADRFRRQAGALLRERGAKVPRQRTARAGPLTESEMKVARLVQEGLRNKEIAASLSYSPRTVEVYLSRVYGKLGVSSRVGLARALDDLPT